MARISLKCSCGWNFFIAGTAQGHETPCPNCAIPVPIPGRKASEGGPKAPGVIAAEKQSKQKQVVLLVSIGAAVALVAVVLLVATSGGPKPIEEPETPRGHNPVIGKPNMPRAGVVNTPQNPAPGSNPAELARDPNAPVGANRETQIEEHKKTIRLNVWRQNVAGIATESLRLRNHLDAAGGLQERMKSWDLKIDETLRALLELGERFNVEPHIQAGDKLVVFAQKDLTTMKPSAADQTLLSPWLRAFRAGQPLEQVVILRGAQRTELFLQFPEATPDLLEIARLPDIAGAGRYVDPPDAPGTTPFPALSAGPIPDAVLKDIEGRFGALPTGYRGLLSAGERGRLETLMKAKAGSADDMAFLGSRVQGEALPAFEREVQILRAKADELQAKLKETTAVDVVHFKDGRKVTGQVLEQTEQVVKIKAKLGSMTIPAADVAKVERGKGAGLEFPAQLAAAPKTAEGMSKLLAWCQTQGLKLEAEYVGVLLLQYDPLNEAARKVTNIAKPAFKASGAAPSPVPAPMGAPSGGEQVIRAMDTLAGDVVRRYPAFGDVIAQMRSGASSHAFANQPVPPARAARAVSLIKDPLSFDLSLLDASGALEIGQWWGSLSGEDRREFARFFGLWCARERYARGAR